MYFKHLFLIVILQSIRSVFNACSDGELCLNGGECLINGGREKCVCKSEFYGVVCSEYSSSFQLLFKNNAVPTTSVLKPFFEEDSITLASISQTAIAGVYTFVFHTKLDSPKIIQATFEKHTELETLSQNIVSIEDVDECNEKTSTVCPTSTKCRNTIGSFSCECESGYEKKNNICVETESSVWEADGVVTWLVVIGIILVVLIFTISCFYARKWFRNRKQQKAAQKAESDATDNASVKVASEVNSYATGKNDTRGNFQHGGQSRNRSYEDRLSVLSAPTYNQYNRRYTPQSGPQSHVSRSRSMRSTTNHARQYPGRTSRLPSSSSNVPFVNRYYDVTNGNMYGRNNSYGFSNGSYITDNNIAIIPNNFTYAGLNNGDNIQYNYQGLYEPTLQYGDVIMEDPGITFNATNRYGNNHAPSYNATTEPYTQNNLTYDISTESTNVPQARNNGAYLTDYQV